jgi:tetratricopeptide (TPR) repeat protein
VVWPKVIFGLMGIVLIFIDFRYLVPAYAAGRWIHYAELSRDYDKLTDAREFYHRASGHPNPYSDFLLMNLPQTDRRLAADPAGYKISASKVPELIAEARQTLSNLQPHYSDYLNVQLENPILDLVESPQDPQVFARAQAKFDALISAYPQHEYLYLYWGRVLMGDQRYVEATQVFQTVATKFAHPPAELVFWQGVAGIASGKLSHAQVMEYINQSIQRSVGFSLGDETSLRSIVQYLISHNEYIAARYFQKLLVDLQSSDAKEHMTLSYIYSKTGELDLAVKEARQAVKLDASLTGMAQGYLQALGRSL